MTPVPPTSTTAPCPGRTAGTSSAAALADELMILVHETAEYHAARGAVAAALGDARRGLDTIRRRIERAGGRHAVAVVGLSNVGKSTLLDAILGDEIAPRRNGPCTAFPVEFLHGPEMVVTVHHETRLDRPSWRFEDPRDVRGCLERLNDGEAAAARGGVRRVEVTLPSPLLAGGLVIADTPGFGAGHAEAGAGLHEAALMAYLRRDVGQVFWVVLADQGIGRREVEFRDRFFAEVCDDLVVTGCEDWDSDDRARFRARFSALLGDRAPAFHFVSGLQGLDARRDGDARGLEAAGIAELERRIRGLADPAGRLRAAEEGLVRLAEDLSRWLAEYRDDRGRPPSPWWRPDSWLRWAAFPPSPLKARLDRALAGPP